MASEHAVGSAALSAATPADGLPPAPLAQGHYQPGVIGDRLVLTAGMTPRVDGVLQVVGRVGEDVTVEQAQQGAAIAAGNALSAAAATAGSLDAVERVLRMTVYVNAGPDFTEHTRVADGASRRLAELIGERGAAVRSALGVSSLPGGACVEVELTCLRHA